MSEKKWVERVAGLIIACILAAGYIYWRGPSHIRVGFEPGRMPACDSTPVRHLFVESFENSPVVKQSGVKLIKLGDFTDLDHDGTPTAIDPKQEVRQCSAILFLSTGQDDVNFRIKWTDKRKETIWLEEY